MVTCEELFDKYKNQIYSLCLKLSKNKPDAEDLFGDTWALVSTKIINFKEDLNPFNYIYTVCLNIYRKSLRKKSKNLNIDFKTEKKYAAFLENSASIENTESKIIDNEEKFLLKKAINNLDDKYRIPLILYYYKECSYTDVADIMELPLSTIKYRLSFAKEILQRTLGKGDENG